MHRIAAGLLLLPLSFAQEPPATRAQADAILQELREIRKMLAQQQQGEQKPQTHKIAIAANEPRQGKADAPITMVEYTDYQCSFCQRFHTVTFPEIKEKFIATGKVRFYSRDLPLDFHPQAKPAAVAARCAGEQNKFWELRDILVANPRELGREQILKHAAGLLLQPEKFKSCLDSGKYAAAIARDMQEAQKLGIEGTPSFLIGKTTPEGVEGYVVVGAHPISTFEAVIQKLSE